MDLAAYSSKLVSEDFQNLKNLFHGTNFQFRNTVSGNLPEKTFTIVFMYPMTLQSLSVFITQNRKKKQVLSH